MKPNLNLDGVLRAVHGDGGTTPAAGETTEPMAAVSVPLPGERATPGQVARRDAAGVARAGRSRLREWKQKEGSIAAGLMAGKPRSYAEQAAHAGSHEWATEGHEGDVADLLHTEYANLIGKPGTAIGLTVAALSQHWVAGGVGFLVVLGGVETLLAWAGQATAVIWLPLTVVAVLVVNYLIIAWIAAHDREAREQQAPAPPRPSIPSER